MDRRRFRKWLVTGGCVVFVGWGVAGCTKEAMFAYWASKPPVQAEKSAKITPQIPTAAQNQGLDFLSNWFYLGKKENSFDRVDRLKAYMTDRAVERVQQEGLMLNENQEVHSIRPMDNEAQWLIEGEKAILTYKVTFKDGREVYYNVPMVRSGKWLADGIPGVTSEPQKKPYRPKITDPNLDADQMNQLQSDADAFFSAWMSGKPINRYTTEKLAQTLPKENLLDKLNATYDSVTLYSFNRKPVQYEAVVKLVDTKGHSVFQQYLLTLEEKDGQWFVSDLK